MDGIIPHRFGGDHAPFCAKRSRVDSDGVPTIGYGPILSVGIASRRKEIEMTHKVRQRVGWLVVLFLLAGVPAAAWACKSAGAFKHVGVVTAVDLQALTLTMTDAETGEPITFAATAKQLKDVKPGDQVMVGFVEKDGKLTAVQIHS
jgi:Cu/Ag efflux protein CusF